jgi:hypothetical protein
LLREQPFNALFNPVAKHNWAPSSTKPRAHIEKVSGSAAGCCCSGSYDRIPAGRNPKGSTDRRTPNDSRET